MKKLAIISLLFFILAPASATGQDKDRSIERKPKTFVLIAGGINKDLQQRLAKGSLIKALQRFFLDEAKIDKERLIVLTEKNSISQDDPRLSTALNINRQLDKIAASITTSDRFIFYYIGQANIVSGQLRLNLPAEDITHLQLSKWLGTVKCGSMLVVLDCPGAELAVKPIAAPGRIIIAAARKDQPYSTRFTKYFLGVMKNKENDTDKNGKISLLEAFTAVTKQIGDFYKEKQVIRTEHPLLEDNGDGTPEERPSDLKIRKTDGKAASLFFF